jgi:hypothetical protein
VQNKFLFDNFNDQRTQLAHKLGHAPSERQLWHGTRAVPPQVILNSEEGFDHRCSRDGMWGAGAYFAVESQYSVNYAHRVGDGKQQIVLASVLVGDSVELTSDRTLRKPPTKTRREGDAADGIDFGENRFDSVTGHTGGSQIFVVYSHGRAYPQYLLTFR